MLHSHMYMQMFYKAKMLLQKFEIGGDRDSGRLFAHGHANSKW